MRSAFLIKSWLEKEAFIAIGMVCANIVDVSRLFVYGFSFYTANFAAVRNIWPVVVAATFSAFAEAYIGSRLIGKVTLATIRALVGVIMVIIALGMVSGVL